MTKLNELEESVDKIGSYINCDFIEGTAIENERIWSIATNILSNNRADMMSVWFATILFLKYNQTLWESKVICMQELQSHRKNEAEKNTNRLVQRKADLFKSLGISDEQSSNLDLLFEDAGQSE